MRYSFLSHKYSWQLPVFGEEREFVVSQLKSITAGDSSNSFSAEIQSHWGTHIDAPRHFFSNGPSITDYSADHFVFTEPQVIPVALNPSELLVNDSLVEMVREDCDLLLLKSGWTESRSLPRYYQENPGISPELAMALRNHCPKLRAVGIDWISISAFNHREAGREAHRLLLDPGGTQTPVFLIEDMDLSADMRGLQRVIVAPLRFAAFDSAPCTVFGEWDD